MVKPFELDTNEFEVFARSVVTLSWVIEVAQLQIIFFFFVLKFIILELSK